MKLIVILLVFYSYCSIANCNILILSNILDKYVPNVFIRWSGVRIIQSWKKILPQEMKINKHWTSFDKRFGKRYSYKINQDCESGIDQTTDFKKSCIGILKELKIYKNDKIVNQFCKKNQHPSHVQYVKTLINGGVLLKIIQIARHKSKNDDFKINIILKNNTDNIFYSIEAYCCDNYEIIKLKSIEITKILPLKTTDNSYQQYLQLHINS